MWKQTELRRKQDPVSTSQPKPPPTGGTVRGWNSDWSRDSSDQVDGSKKHKADKLANEGHETGQAGFFKTGIKG